MCFRRICIANSTREAGAFFHVLSSLSPSWIGGWGDIFWCFKSFCLDQSPVFKPGTALTKKKGRKRKNKKKKKKAGAGAGAGAGNSKENTQEISSFTFEELVNATNNFSSECLGEGGFGKVYKGHLDKGNQVAAIKKLNQGSHEFSAEVDAFRKANHPNIVKLLGFCAEKEHTLLVYEYMALGSLDSHLFGLPPARRRLDWETRIKIAIDLASGMQYLHDKMIHGINLKTSNILLGEGYHVKLSNLGMKSVRPTGDESAHLARKSDIYSLGVVLLQLITGRLAYDPQRPLEEQILVDWVMSLYPKIDTWKYKKLADPLLKGKYHKEDLRQVLRIAVWSINPRAVIRPDIKEVVQSLSKCYPPKNREVVQGLSECHPPKNDPSQIHLLTTPIQFEFLRKVATMSMWLRWICLGSQ